MQMTWSDREQGYVDEHGVVHAPDLDAERLTCKCGYVVPTEDDTITTFEAENQYLAHLGVVSLSLEGGEK